MERIILENMVKFLRENYATWYEQYETVALHYGEAGRAWKNEAPYELLRPSPDDKVYDDLCQEYKDKVFMSDYESWKKDIKEYRINNQALSGSLMTSLG
jgi:hypothetical protein